MSTSEEFIDLAFERLDLGAIEIELDAKASDRVYIHHFKSTFPNEGNGRDAMQTLIGLADSAGITLVLFAKAEQGPHNLSQTDLQSWYERLGFELGDFHGHFERHPLKQYAVGIPKSRM